MVTVEELQTKFNGLVPTGVTFTLNELVCGSKEDVNDICEEWGLKGTKAICLKYVYDNYPIAVARSSQQPQQGK